MQFRYFALRHAFVILEGHPQWTLDIPFLDDKYDLLSGNRITQNWNPLIFAFSYDRIDGVREHPDYPAIVGEHVNACSQRMAEIIINFDAEAIEFLPFRTRNSIGEDITTHYRLMNCLKWISAIDKKRSLLSNVDAGFRLHNREYDLEKVVLDPVKFNGPLFCINGWPHQWVIREDLVHALNGAGITGLTLEDLPFD